MFPLYRMFAIFCLALASNFVVAQSNFWEPLNGPNGVQDIIEISSDGSGKLFMYMDSKIYTSTDNGDSWNECMTGIAQTSIYWVKFLLSPSGTFYVHLEGSSGKLYRYVPASNSWTHIPLPFSPYDVNGIDIDPQGRMWVSTNESYSVLHYSTDGGQTFQQVTASGQMQGWFDILTTYNDDHNLIAVSYGATQKVYHFTKSGAVQQVITGSSMKYLGYNPHTGTAYYADYDNNKRSTDGGLTWQNMTLVPGQNWQPEILKMFFEPGGKIWAHASSVMYKSEDDGLTWTQDATLSSIYGNFFRVNNSDWFATNSCGFPNFSRSSDGGATWTDLSEQFQQPEVQDIKKDAAGTLYAYTCRRSAYEKSSDGGQTWSDLVIQDSTAARVISLATRPDGVLMAVGENNKSYRSFDNGVSWAKLTDFPPDSYADVINPRFYSDQNGFFYWFHGLSGAIKSTDNGNTWTSLSTFYFGYGDVAIHPNGDIYQSDVGLVTRYIADLDTAVYLEYNGETLYDATTIHCTSSGDIYIGGFFSGLQNESLFRVINGSSIVEGVSFFNQKTVLQVTSNAEGDIYVFALEGLYRSDNGGLDWTLVDSLPLDYLYDLSAVYISPDQYLYAGYYGNVIHRSAQPTAESNLIFGKIWLDNDGDCEYDAGEQLQTSTAVTATGNGDYTSFSGYLGNFILSAPSGTYALNVQPPNALYEACFSDVPVTLNGPNDSAVVNLPLKAVAQCPYLRVSMSAPILRRCFDVTYTVRYKNEGTAVAEGAYVEVTLDSFFIFQNSTLPVALQNGFTYKFELGNLAPGQSGSFNVTVKISCEASLGETHCVAAQIHPSDVCLPTLPLIAFYRECRENIGSFDPNDKRAFVDGKEEPGYVLPNTDIEYLIRFQNTGTDTAFRVIVEDRLSTLLDLASVTPLVASHPYTMELKDQRRLRFIFDNVLLPDSNINEAASHGFIKFQVSQMPNVALGSLIKNEADIFFDFNAPVRTNESNLVVGTVSTKPEPGNPYLVAAYPNPFGTSVTFEIKGPALPGNVTLRLFDALGRQVFREEFGSEKFVIQRDALETGLYYFLIESDGKQIGAGKVEAK